jgi:hypothetical protein
MSNLPRDAIVVVTAMDGMHGHGIVQMHEQGQQGEH